MSQDSSGEKTEKASSKKKRDARKKGEVHKSNDAVSALSMLVMFAVIGALWDDGFAKIQVFLAKELSGPYVTALAEELAAGSMPDIAYTLSMQAVQLLLPLFAVAMLVGVIGNVVQTGPLFVPNRVAPKFSKINPINGFKRIFSSVTLVELAKSVFKVIIMGVLIYGAINGSLTEFPNMMMYNPGAAFGQVMDTCFELGVQVGGTLLIFSLADMFYQWWKFEKDLRMTKQEVKEEYKQLEGDPQIKGKIRQKQRSMSAARMMQQVPTADVVVTNPTHFAVALRYDDAVDKAPVVVAKGQDFLAQRIKEKAGECNIAIVENKPVARALYAACEIGHEIPPQMYQAIADILVYVYRLKSQVKGSMT